MILSLLFILCCFWGIHTFTKKSFLKEDRLFIFVGYTVKLAIAGLFYYLYFYKIPEGGEPSDAQRFLNESNLLFDVLFKSKSDFLALLTGIGDNARMLHTHMKESFLWDAGNFTLINDTRNTIRVLTIIRFVSGGNQFVPFILINILSLVGVFNIYKAFKPFSNLPSKIQFFTILLLPNLLLWSSGILKEPFMILGLGLFLRGVLNNRNNRRNHLYIIAGVCLLILFKPYILTSLIPALIFFGFNKYIFKGRLLRTSLFLILLISLPLASSFVRDKVASSISRKQFDLNNVGEGGVHAFSVENYCYYYFKPYQYEAIQVNDYTIDLLDSVTAIELSVIHPKNKPKKIFLSPEIKGEDTWQKHIIMPGTNSYFKPTLINDSFTRLILNIPEAIINAYFRPFFFDSGSKLKYPTMFEVWGLTLFLILAIIFRKQNKAVSFQLIISIALFSLSLLLLIGWITPITGALVRFRFPAQLGVLIISLILIDFNRIKRWKTIV
ncbi:MAG: hypothetical protein ACON4M_06175 [Crocinitomicaceae bacterium]